MYDFNSAQATVNCGYNNHKNERKKHDFSAAHKAARDAEINNAAKKTKDNSLHVNFNNVPVVISSPEVEYYDSPSFFSSAANSFFEANSDFFDAADDGGNVGHNNRNGVTEANSDNSATDNAQQGKKECIKNCLERKSRNTLDFLNKELKNENGNTNENLNSSSNMKKKFNSYFNFFKKNSNGESKNKSKDVGLADTCSSEQIKKKAAEKFNSQCTISSILDKYSSFFENKKEFFKENLTNENNQHTSRSNSSISPEEELKMLREKKTESFLSHFVDFIFFRNFSKFKTLHKKNKNLNHELTDSKSRNISNVLRRTKPSSRIVIAVFVLLFLLIIAIILIVINVVYLHSTEEKRLCAKTLSCGKLFTVAFPVHITDKHREKIEKERNEQSRRLLGINRAADTICLEILRAAIALKLNLDKDRVYSSCVRFDTSFNSTINESFRSTKMSQNKRSKIYLTYEFYFDFSNIEGLRQLNFNPHMNHEEYAKSIKSLFSLKDGDSKVYEMLQKGDCEIISKMKYEHESFSTPNMADQDSEHALLKSDAERSEDKKKAFFYENVITGMLYYPTDSKNRLLTYSAYDWMYCLHDSLPLNQHFVEY